MAGGMNKRGQWGSMADRLAHTRDQEPPEPPLPPEVKHCWVDGPAGRVPGLLLGWRNVEGVWSGRVVRPVWRDEGWHVIEEWVEAGLLEPYR